MPVIDLLEGVAPEVPDRHLSDDEEEGNAVLLRRVNGDGGIAGAGAAADAGNAGAPGQPGVGQRHEPRAGLVPAHHRVDVGPPMQRVEEAEIALARDAEDPVDAVRDQAVDDQFTGTPQGTSPHRRL